MSPGSLPYIQQSSSDLSQNFFVNSGYIWSAAAWLGAWRPGLPLCSWGRHLLAGAARKKRMTMRTDIELAPS